LDHIQDDTTQQVKNNKQQAIENRRKSTSSFLGRWLLIA